MKISPARNAAFDILFRIETERAYSSVLLPIFEDGLPPADRGLAHELVMGTLRRQLYLDRIIDMLARQKKLDIEVRIALRLGLYQLRFLDKVPHHPAINESVELVSRAKKRSAKGFVNALLRRSVREDVKLTFSNDVDRLSVETSHPRWLVERWVGQFGLDAAAAIAEANNTRPRVTFRLCQPGVPIDSNWEPSDILSGVYRAGRLDRDLRELARQGSVYFQDEASQIVASSVKIPAGGSFLDISAAPGGKTGMIAANDPDARLIVGGDLHSARVRLLRENLASQGVRSVSVVRHNAENSLPFSEESFDCVLVDAPCTGTGTIRHNPEIRYYLSPDDPIELSKKQQKILINASKVVKPGGTLLYSTCSLEGEEGEHAADAFLNENRGFGKIRPDVPDKFLTKDGYARTWPHRDEMDGFFIAAFVKRG